MELGIISIALLVGGLLMGWILKEHSLLKKKGLKNVDFLINDWKYSYSHRVRK